MNTLANFIPDFVGRLHPLFVHLPIGILVVALVLYWWEYFDRRKDFGAAVNILFLLGTAAAVLSSLTGLVLAREGEHELTTLSRHRNTAIALTLVALYFWIITRRGVRGWRGFYLSISLMIFLLVTGHLGASLTHGSDYLFPQQQNEVKLGPFEDINEAVVYADLVAPILQQKCVSCHGPGKQKGKLRLDGEEYIRKGGKSGAAIGEDAEILTRVLLPPDDEDHMPPKEKGQLRPEHIAIVQWWIKGGADFRVRVREIQQGDTIRKVLASIQAGVTEEAEGMALHLPEVEPAPGSVIEQLKAAGFKVVPIAEGSNLLSISLFNVRDTTASVWNRLRQLSGQAWYLRGDHKLIDLDAVVAISELRMLRKLSLAGATINDSAINYLIGLQNLESLNLSGTSVSAAGIQRLSEMPNLKRLYLFNSKLDSSNIVAVRSALKQVEVEAGIQKLPLLPGDTSRIPLR